ncbi:hypothetical protein BDZ45DRAFT_748106 [Acephala macrosclerotiorum]|nr:hypothetical protein BDZ45DRAFT_748106 [Acephala macrosclerotiorum]
MAANVIPLDLTAISVIEGLDLDGLYQSLRVSELVEQYTFQVLRVILSADTSMVIDDERANNDGTMSANTRSAMRDKINTLSRPYLRPLRILDMPDEILIKIFELVNNLEERWTLDDSGIGSEEIKNVRLTCRRFCNTSSHLFLQFLSVEISSASLSHLKEVSRHSTISTGVRTLRVVVDFYDSLLAKDFRTFADFNIDDLSTTIQFMELMNVVIDGPNEVTVYLENEERDLEAVRKLKIILQPWNRLLVEISDGIIPEEDVGFQGLLRKAHQEYGRRFAKQQAALENGTFVRAVAATISRMPRANRLEVQDFDDSAERKRSASALEQANDPSALFQHLVLGHLWEKTISRCLGQMPTALIGLLVKLPIAIHKEGSSILNFGVEYRLPRASPLLSQLKNNFGFRGHYTAVAKSPFCPLDWTFSSFDGAGRGFEQLNNTVLSLIIRSIHQLSGTWADALNILRRKRPGSLQRPLGFETSSGAECEGMSQEAYEAVFQKDLKNSADASQAEKACSANETSACILDRYGPPGNALVGGNIGLRLRWIGDPEPGLVAGERCNTLNLQRSKPGQGYDGSNVLHELYERLKENTLASERLSNLKREYLEEAEFGTESANGKVFHEHSNEESSEDSDWVSHEDSDEYSDSDSMWI